MTDGVIAAALFVVCGLAAQADDGLRTAAALSDEVRTLASAETYWPGFGPSAVPLAIFDGTRTYLFRHPAPPEGFIEEAGAYVWQGRHPSVVANSSAAIGGIPTATVMLESFSDSSSLRERAGVVVHEAFHVFQGTTGRRWGANEVDLFTYPVDDARLLALRRLETEAFRRALSARDRDDSAAWAWQALQLRRERYGLMEPSFPAYERGIESQEGTAAYVENRVSGGQPHGFLDSAFDADDVRNRAYCTGVALALLLDRFAPGWKLGFGEDDSRFLDTDLARILGTAGGADRESFTWSEREDATDRAVADVEAMVTRRKEVREEFLSKPGWRLVFEAGDERPLWPQQFDPLNVTRVDGGVLHKRFLRVGSEAGTVEIMGGVVLTEGVGPHPLFNGVRRMLLTGLREEPSVATDEARVTVTTPCCVADLSGAVVSVSDSTVTIRLGSGELGPGEPSSKRSG
jgi:hypothetical protein